MTGPDDSRLVDTSQFASLSDALESTHPRSTYNDLASKYFAHTPDEAEIPQLVLQSMLVRMNGLHQGIHRELSLDNPFGVWPLMRAFFELEVAMLYVSRFPRLITAFAAGPSAKKRGDIPLPSMQKMIYEVRDEIETGAEAYRELCDLAHTGSLATWSAFNVKRDDDDTLNLSWSSQPRFRDGQALIAAAQLKQLSESAIYIFHKLIQQFLA
jgi:hypothetical protein